jgi:AraC-like DNA-binding protein
MEIIERIILVGAIQGFFLSFFIMVKKNMNFHRLFAFILFLITLAFSIAYLQIVLDVNSFPFLIKLNLLFPLAFIPLLIVFLKKITGTFQKNQPLNFLFFLPLLLFLGYNLPFYFANNEIKIDYFLRFEMGNKASISEILEDVLIEFTLCLFSIWAVIEAKSYAKRIDDVFSNHTKTKIGWINFLSFSMFTLTFFAFVLSLIPLFLDQVPLEFHFITAIGSTLIVYYIAYFFLINPDALKDISDNLRHTFEMIETEAGKQVKKQEDLNAEIEHKILQVLEHQKLYQNPELTIGELSEKSGIPVYLTSKIINQNLKTNFYTLVNRYRLQQVKKELMLYPKKTIIEIAYGAGFNSKTTFYEVFKKETGIAPSEFIQQNKSAN